MRSIQNKIILLATLSSALTVAFGLLTFFSFQSYARFLSEYEDSYGFVDSVYVEQKGQLSNEEKAALKRKAKALTPEFRSKALMSALEKPTRRNSDFLLRVETEYRRYLAPLILYTKKRTTYFGGIAIFSSLIAVLLVVQVVRRLVLSPIDDLSQKMEDFLNDRYTYKFSVPKQDEIGQLHSTFNNMAQKVLSQIEELKSLDKAKSEFLSIASHELRTPLTSIKGSLSLLNSGVAGQMNETSSQLMTIALNETDRLIRLINELLDLAKIEARQFPLDRQWVWASELTNKTFASLQGLCQSAHVQLEAIGGHDLDLFIDFDRAQQVLTNLLSNAIKYSPKGASIVVRLLVTEQNEVQIEVSDQGQGIAPEDQDLIFEKFRQVTNSRNPLVKGTGLGLAIAKALVEQHGGQIGVRSSPGEGSTFYFTLPKWKVHDHKHEVPA